MRNGWVWVAGIVVLFGAVLFWRSLLPQPAADLTLLATPQTIAVEVQRPVPTLVRILQVNPPIPGRIDVLKDGGVAMKATQDGGESWFLVNGTRVQIIQAAGPRSQVQVMDGQYRNRVGWIPTNAVTT